MYNIHIYIHTLFFYVLDNLIIHIDSNNKIVSAIIVTKTIKI